MLKAIPTVLTMCIHPDMIVDDLGIPIKDVTKYTDDFCETMITGFTKLFVSIAPNALGENVPSKELLLTGAHPIVVNGKEITANKLINNTTIKWKKYEYEIPVYCIKFKERKSIKMHGIDVVQWGEKEFDKMQKSMNIKYNGCGFIKHKWNNNKIQS